MTAPELRLESLRTELTRRGLAGFIVPLTDEHMSEYVGGYAQRLRWLTGFDGSAGTAAVLPHAAAIVTDGRYSLQVRAQVDQGLWTVREVPAEPLGPWLAEHAPGGAIIGYDPWLHTRAWVAETQTFLDAGGARLVPVSDNPVDAVWPDRPAPSAAPARIHDIRFAGRTSAEKRAAIAEGLRSRGLDAAVIAALDSVAWLFNIRGADVPRTPVVRAFSLLRADGTATLFIDDAKVTPDVAAHLGPEVTVAPYASVTAALGRLQGQQVLIDPAFSVAALAQALEAGGATIREGRDPCILPKATKNPVEVEGARATHVRDGLALTRFLAWFDAEAPKGTLDELSAQARLEVFRRESNLLEDLSFDTISGFGPNGAIIHYRASEATALPIEQGNIYLVDSGGQYPDGTTDVTRTIAVGTPPPEAIRAFTLVLKGHIGLATARFPKGTRGGQLDILARQHLWAAGLDYAHGTGHGVGSFLSVHEGPQRIAAVVGAPGIDEPLLPGMILSNEPGFYRNGAFGIRIENLVLVVEDPQPGDEREMLAFETLTLAPIDVRLVDPGLLSSAERAWLDAYHARVRETHAAALDGEARAWLEAATAPLSHIIARAA
ncbi:MAG: aminopeptidase P family protein [Thermaurantiacus sp.]